MSQKVIIHFPDLESEDDDPDDNNTFYMSCAENRINALIERMREFRDNLSRPDEFENEAVSMAIEQHGLKKNSSENLTDTCCDCSNDVSVNNLNCNPSINVATTSSSNQMVSYDEKDEDDGPSRSKKQRCSYETDMICDQSEESFNFNDVDFMNEAVAVAIEKKGLSSTSLVDLE